MMKKEKVTTATQIRRIIAYIVLVIITILCLFWFYILFINSTRSHAELTKGFTLLPSSFIAKNLGNVLLHGTLPIARGMLNSLLISASSAILTTYFSAMTAFAIHAYRFRGRKAIFTFILAIMMIPTQVTSLGFVRLMTSMNLMDNFIPLIVPSIAAPVVFFYMKQSMDATLPASLMEAARIDGASEVRIFNTIVIPLMKPAIAVQAIFAFVSTWNNYFLPALILHKDYMKTLPILIAQLRAADFLKFDMGQVYATIAFSIFPVIVVYLLLSKYIVGGTTAGAVKG
ncbi:MAG: carbohydrate ABC transporter permease [Lachnospiraceae bacterium]|nr:carbohydrate ABC transporter permease [Lachnospiraceae bacterium]